MKGKIFWGFILLIILAILIFFYNCTKKSTRYEFRRGYYLYASDTGGSARKQIYVFSTQTDSLVDSIYLGPYTWPGELALSPDKRTLYVTVELFDTFSYTATITHYEMDTRTKAIKYIGPNSSTIISPDGKYLFGAVGRNFTIFDACTHNIIFQDSIFFSTGCFDKNAYLAYGSTERLGEIRRFNYESKNWINSLNIYLWDGRIPALDDYLLSPDGRTLYLLARYFDDFYFCVFDLTQDSLLIQLGINSIGQLAIKPDGSIVYITDPGGGGGCIAIEPPPSGKLGVFDTKTNTPLAGISLDVLADSIHPPPLNPFFIKITPDGRKAYLSICHDRILVIDLTRNEPLKAIILPDYRNLALYFIAL